MSLSFLFFLVIVQEQITLKRKHSKTEQSQSRHRNIREQVSDSLGRQGDDAGLGAVDGG